MKANLGRTMVCHEKRTQHSITPNAVTRNRPRSPGNRQACSLLLLGQGAQRSRAGWLGHQQGHKGEHGPFWEQAEPPLLSTAARTLGKVQGSAQHHRDSTHALLPAGPQSNRQGAEAWPKPAGKPPAGTRDAPLTHHREPRCACWTEAREGLCFNAASGLEH